MQPLVRLLHFTNVYKYENHAKFCKLKNEKFKYRERGEGGREGGGEKREIHYHCKISQLKQDTFPPLKGDMNRDSTSVGIGKS